jgi:hypothetical protein
LENVDDFSHRRRGPQKVRPVTFDHPGEQPESVGDQAQVHRIVRQVVMSYREIERPEIPAPLKWAAAILAGLFTTGTAALAFWLVSSVSEMQVTLARMDERLAGQTLGQDARFEDHDRRIRTLEGYHGGK